MGWLPKNKLLCAELRVTETVARQAESPGSNLVSYSGQVAIELLVGGVGAPVNVHHLSQHAGVGAVECFLHLLSEGPAFASIKKDGFNG